MNATDLMTIHSTNHFKVFRMRVNGVTYYFVGRNEENAGYIFAFVVKKVAIAHCNRMERELQNNTLIM